jgi:hypothetical protein
MVWGIICAIFLKMGFEYSNICSLALRREPLTSILTKKEGKRGTGVHGTVLAAKLQDKNSILHFPILLVLRSVMLLKLEVISKFSLFPRMSIANVLVRA